MNYIEPHAEFSLHFLELQSSPWKGERYCCVKLDPEKCLIDQIRNVGLELNGKKESPCPGLSASYTKVFLPKGEENNITPLDLIKKEEDMIGIIYFGQLLPSSLKKTHDDHLLSISNTGIISEKNWFVITRSCLSFDLTKADIVIGATNCPQKQEPYQGEIVYLRGLPWPKASNLACAL
jgi:hypothetical protein